MKDRPLICNSCGRTLEKKDDVLQEDALFIKKEWGYFSEKDLQVHEMVICEKCYDQWIKQLKISPVITEKTEVLNDR